MSSAYILIFKYEHITLQLLKPNLIINTTGGLAKKNPVSLQEL